MPPGRLDEQRPADLPGYVTPRASCVPYGEIGRGRAVPPEFVQVGAANRNLPGLGRVHGEGFMGRPEANLVYYREERIKKSLGWLSPME